MICIGTFAGAHGVRGEAKLRSFTEVPADAAGYGPVSTEDGRSFTLKLVREAKPGLLIVRSPEIATREEAQGLAGTKLFVPRDRLPPPDDEEFYYEDLVGLAAITPDGAPFGTVKAVVNYGAGDLLELTGVPGEKGVLLIPFTKDAVPEIDFDTGKVTIDPPVYEEVESEDDETAP
ncbi:16S rRNA processing protein RimM [Aquisalinus flavus]|nr:ribosome maturation factor RimM [Aquisalinus flavus]MBD0425664.1 16S rRNA processing protein RimM [Aquisalinus flavus]UNE49327.1 16S rRNA processing protein RimM [Aquisalinus flavus]